MARMYPETPVDCQSSAERSLFSLFRDRLSDDWTVFHSVAWLARQVDRGASDGEADFVVTHPVLGALVLEVKGGGIYFDPASGQWFSIDREQHVHEIKDPLRQARRSMYTLRDKLQDAFGLSGYTLGYAVCFPDTSGEEMEPDAQDTRQLVLDSRIFNDPEGALRSISSFWSARNPAGKLGKEGVHQVTQLLSRVKDLPVRLAAQGRGWEVQTRRLTEEQFGLLDVLARQRRVIIAGCAGSGKTMLAVEKARRLGDEGFSVLFTCFNKGLARWVQTQLTDYPSVTVKHFHAFCDETAQRAGIAVTPPGDGEDQASFFRERLPEAVMEALAVLPFERFDAVIVDEGQDLYDTYWIPLMEALKDPIHGIMYIFFDDNQRLYGDRAPTYPFPGEPYVLSKNCRNTQSIHAVVQRFTDADTSCPGPAGRKPEFIDPEGDEHAKLQDVLRRLINEDGVSPSQIAVLTPVREQKSLLADNKRGAIKLNWSHDDHPTAVACSTIQGFKGLERDVVILTELDRIYEPLRDQLLYVAASRPKHHLIVLGDRSAQQLMLGKKT
jgi:Nuclease-related domain/UvrD-like helicase C-terminal domain/AAA domain